MIVAGIVMTRVGTRNSVAETGFIRSGQCDDPRRVAEERDRDQADDQHARASRLAPNTAGSARRSDPEMAM